VVPFLCSSVLPSAADWNAYFLEEAAAGERASPLAVALVLVDFRAAEAVRAGSPVVHSLAPEDDSRERAVDSHAQVAELADSAVVRSLAPEDDSRERAVDSHARAAGLADSLAVHSRVMAAGLDDSPAVHSRVLAADFRESAADFLVPEVARADLQVVHWLAPAVHSRAC
jgi:hypothetical protein